MQTSLTIKTALISICAAAAAAAAGGRGNRLDRS